MRIRLSREKINSDFVGEVESIIGQSLAECYQCGNCTAGCPVSYEMDYPPSQIIRMAQLGMKEEVLSSRAIWVCASCVTCTARCPKEIDIAGVMDAMRIIATRENYPSEEREIRILNRIFLNNIRSYGRQFELKLIVGYNLTSGHFFKDVLKGPKMLFKGKLRFLPRRVRDVKGVKEIFRKLLEDKSR